MNTQTDYAKLLRDFSDKLMMGDVYTELLRQYPQFEVWSGSHNKNLHHYGKGGLLRHTWEIINLGFDAMTTLDLRYKVPPFEFYLAALFHDTGKMYDYRNITSDYTEWQPTEHRRLIHHLPRSTFIFNGVIRHFPELEKEYGDAVLHAILAHHGNREAGSPVAPKTHTAWLLHLCDGISARMDDADRIDVLKKPA
jgi:3'-5' exoribonuclease